MGKETYYQYLSKMSGVKADKDASGKTIANSKKKKVLQIIDSLDLSIRQKNALYLDAGYTETTMGAAPWYDITPKITK